MVGWCRCDTNILMNVFGTPNTTSFFVRTAFYSFPTGDARATVTMRPIQPLQPPPNTLQFLTRFLGRPPAPRRTPRSFSTRPHHPSTVPLRTRTPLRANRKYSTTPTPKQTPAPTPPPTSSTASAAAAAAAAETSSKTTTTARADAILARLPAPLRRYASRLRGAPLTHVVAFLVLHELTAVVPLLGLFGLFHYTEHVPVAWMVGHYGGYVRDGVGRFERYFRRKGWFGFGEGEGEGGAFEGGREEGEGVGEGVGLGKGERKEGEVLERWETDPRYRVVIEVGLAYALTKVLLPVRIVGSLWATPWFAGVLGRLRRVVGRAG